MSFTRLPLFFSLVFSLGCFLCCVSCCGRGGPAWTRVVHWERTLPICSYSSLFLTHFFISIFFLAFFFLAESHLHSKWAKRRGMYLQLEGLGVHWLK